MIENVLKRNCVSVKTRITVKTLVSIGIIALAVVLPQVAHLAVGEGAGVMLLPMYLPVLLGGCLMGSLWGAGIGLLSPLVSYLITSAAGAPMPALARLPFMMAELCVFALITGAFSNKIERHPLLAFPAVIFAQIVGRLSFLALVAVFQNYVPFSSAVIWGQIKTGFIGLAVQAVLVPLMVIGLNALFNRDGE